MEHLRELPEPGFNFVGIRLQGRRASKEYRSKIQNHAGRVLWVNESDPLISRIKWYVELIFYTDKKSLDVDNLAKPILDALTGGYWVNDRQVQKLSVSKYPIAFDSVEGFAIRVCHEGYCRPPKK